VQSTEERIEPPSIRAWAGPGLGSTRTNGTGGPNGTIDTVGSSDPDGSQRTNGSNRTNSATGVNRSSRANGSKRAAGVNRSSPTNGSKRATGTNGSHGTTGANGSAVTTLRRGATPRHGARGADGAVGAVPPGRRSPTPTLAALVDRARAGCALSFERIYRQFAGQVASYLRWHRASDPDGLTNDVFVQVHRNLSTFEGDDTSFRSWLFTIAHHRMIDDRRRANRQPRVNDDVPVEEGVGCGDVEEDAFAVLAHDEVRSLVAVLSPDQRDVVLLRIVADLSVEQVARLLGKRETAVKALQHRALAALRRHLDKRVVRA
jgi:RNA polymerase sigma factor (sigma-70 family)